MYTIIEVMHNMYSISNRNEHKKFKKLQREVDKMAAMMKEDENEDEDETPKEEPEEAEDAEEESEEESESEESEDETDSESSESESEVRLSVLNQAQKHPSKISFLRTGFSGREEEGEL